MKRTIEIEDSLDERAQMAIEEVLDLLREYLKDNPDTDEVPCLSNDLDYSGRVHEIVDGCIPVYTHEIESTWYLYSDQLEEAYDNAGFGDNPRENNGILAIYCYIWDKVNEWYWKHAEDLFQEWYKETHEADEDE